jgi:hypothetical protein
MTYRHGDRTLEIRAINERALRNPKIRPGDFPLGSAASRAAARTILLRQPITVVDFGTLPIPLPSLEEILRDWKDESDRYTHDQRRDNTVSRCAILKDSDAFRRLNASSQHETFRSSSRLGGIESVDSLEVRKCGTTARADIEGSSNTHRL